MLLIADCYLTYTPSEVLVPRQISIVSSSIFCSSRLKRILNYETNMKIRYGDMHTRLTDVSEKDGIDL